MKRMPAVLLIAGIVLAGTTLAEAPGTPAVNGTVRWVDGQKVVNVWGTPYEMGHAQGYLMAREIHDLFAGYVLGLLPRAVVELGVNLMPRLFVVDEEFRLEVQGILAGMEDAGQDTYVAELGRPLGEWDFYLANAFADLRGMLCSSISAWGLATGNDRDLHGGLAMARNLDWTLAGEDHYLLSRETVAIAYDPSDPDRQRVVSVTFPGFIGCLSCMNESGVVAAQNQAHNGVGLWHLNLDEPFWLINMVIRQALSLKDADGDGASTILDVENHIRAHPRSGSYLIHVAQPHDGRFACPAQVIETDNGGTQIRYPANEPAVDPEILLATNHFLLLRPPLPCDRLFRMKRIVRRRNGSFTIPELWDTERQVMQDWLFSTTIHTMLFIPHLRELRVTFSDDGALSGDKTPAILAWEELFPADEDTEPPEDEEYADDADDDDGCGVRW